jgi:pyrroline-5-carboxylate reductase
MRIAIVGAGNLGGAVAAGLVTSGAVDVGDLRCVTRTAEGAARLRAREGLAALAVTQEAVAAVPGADVVMLGVKPSVIVDVLRAIGPHLERHVTLVSLAAGVRLEELVAAAPEGAQVVRLMTNTPVAVRSAVSLVAAAPGVADDTLAGVVALADALGTTHVIDESLFDAATALAGSGPAYVFLLVELLRDAGVALGVTPDAALAMTRGVLDGAARLLAASDGDPVALRRAVTSPGGMTAAAVAAFEDADLRGTVVRALTAAVERAAELSTSPPKPPADA